MEQGSIANWKKKVGDKINPGDVLCQVETDKATLDFEWVGDAGYIAKLAFQPGHPPVSVGTAIAVLVTEQSELEEGSKIELGQPEAKKASPAPPSTPAPAATPPPPPCPEKQTKEDNTTFEAGSFSRVRASPAALSLLANNVKGTGPQGRITQKDVEQFLSQKGTSVGGASAPEAHYTDTAASMMRRVIAKRLTESTQNIPHFFLTVEIKTKALKALISDLNEKGKGEYKLTANDFIIKASALACKQVPQATHQWLDGTIRAYKSIDISVAVATPTGLVTPVVFNADLKGLKEISSDVKSLADLAKKGQLTPEQYTGGVFTVSNLGSYGVKQFTAIINPPQACILAVGAIQEDGTLNVTLSCDHRVVDGAVGATWLKAFKSILEQPTTLLL